MGCDNVNGEGQRDKFTNRCAVWSLVAVGPKRHHDINESDRSWLLVCDRFGDAASIVHPLIRGPPSNVVAAIPTTWFTTLRMPAAGEGRPGPGSDSSQDVVMEEKSLEARVWPGQDLINHAWPLLGIFLTL